MVMTHQVLAEISAGISELKKNPMAVVNEGGVAPVAGHYVLIPKDMIALMELSDGSPLKVVCSKEKMVIAKVEK